MFCHSCGKQILENARFCSHCGIEQASIKEDIKSHYSTGMSASESALSDFLQSASPKELYSKAFDYYESGDFMKAGQICTYIFNRYPDAKEVKWIINNLPLAVERTNLTENTNLLVKQTQTQRDVVRFIIGIAILGATYFLFNEFRYAENTTVRTVSLIIIGLIGISGLVMIGNVLFNKRDR